MGFNITMFPPGAFHVRKAPLPLLLPQTDFITDEDWDHIVFIERVHIAHCCIVIMACDALLEQIREEEEDERT